MNLFQRECWKITTLESDGKLLIVDVPWPIKKKMQTKLKISQHFADIFFSKIMIGKGKAEAILAFIST